MFARAFSFWMLATVLAVAGCAPRQGGGTSGGGRDAEGAEAAAVAAGVAIAGYGPATPERLAAAGWRTDLTRREVALDAIRTRDLRRDAIVPIAAPEHAAARDVDLDPAEPVLVVRGREEVHAWPLAHLRARELALDRVDGAPVAVTFCSVCGTARVWDRRLGERTLELGVSGMLLEGNSLLWDRGTESLWRQIDGRAVAGELAGRAMESLPAFVVSFGTLAEARPDARVMLPPGPASDPPFRTLTGEEVARGEPPPWLSVSCPRPLEPALGVADGAATAVAGPPVENLGDVVVFRDARAGTPYRAAGGPSEPWGSAAAFHRTVGGRTLTFEAGESGDGAAADARPTAPAAAIVDVETGTRWNLLGEAVEGPLAGSALEVVDQVAGFRFAVTGGR
jgi:hypothetical protein